MAAVWAAEEKKVQRKIIYLTRVEKPYIEVGWQFLIGKVPSFILLFTLGLHVPLKEAEALESSQSNELSTKTSEHPR